ncbi:MAG: TIGR03767 family metallophosphoesterase [Candidatus Nanopelagicales bacterium]
MSDTRHARLTRSPHIAGQFRRIVAAPGEELSVDSGWRSLASLIHLSDLHICDAQSPSRVEYFDRYADPDSVHAEELGYVGVYRPQEMLTTQVLAAAVDAANHIQCAPSGAPIDAVVITGDTVDNAQWNEMRWYHTLLDGGSIVPSSGDTAHWEGVGGPADPDERYWHPEGGVDDLPRRRYGFPTIDGFFELAQRTVTSPGLRHQWFAIHGNHDALLQGVTPPDAEVQALSTGDRRITKAADGVDVVKLLLDFSPIGPASFPLVPASPSVAVTSDAERGFMRAGDYAASHLSCGHGHGFTAENVSNKNAFWTRELGDEVLLVALDTVNRHGGWHGCVDRAQFDWLRKVLESAGDRYVIIMSHHPLETLVNGYTLDEAPPALGDEVAALLLAFPQVVLWLAGHTHRHQISFHGTDEQHGFWHVRTSSLIDWPQQSRVVELLEDQDDLVIATYVFDHAGTAQPDLVHLEDGTALAGLSRWLAANHWQRQEGEHALDLLEGRPEDRNMLLRVAKR